MTTLKPIVVAWDVDGVLGDFRAWCVEKHGIDLTDWNKYDLTVCYPPDVARRIMQTVEAGDYIAELPVIEGATEAVRSVLDAGIRQLFITSIPQRFFDARLRWLYTHLGVPVRIDQLICVDRQPKVDACINSGVTHAIDDRLETIIALHRADIEAFLMPSTYMWDGIGELPQLKGYVANPKQFAEIVIEEMHG